MKAIPAIARTLLVASALALPAAAWATPPAAIPNSSNEARSSFQRFAKGWMERMQKLEVRNRRNPTLRTGSVARASYRGYGDDFSIELKPTGHPQAPYVGILRYEERLYTCSDRKASRCSIASTTPVTEIFRFQGGRWIY